MQKYLLTALYVLVMLAILEHPISLPETGVAHIVFDREEGIVPEIEYIESPSPAAAIHQNNGFTDIGIFYFSESINMDTLRKNLNLTYPLILSTQLTYIEP